MWYTSGQSCQGIKDTDSPAAKTQYKNNSFLLHQTLTLLTVTIILIIIHLWSPTVPSTVPAMHQLSRAPDSITLSWPQPDRPNGDILEYQLRYYDKAHAHTHAHVMLLL